MKTIKAEINLYSYDELKDKSREKAFDEHLDFLYRQFYSCNLQITLQEYYIDCLLTDQ